MKKVIAFFVGVLFVLACYWLSGYNFDTRGAQAVGVLFNSMLAGCITFLMYMIYKTSQEL